MTTKNLLPKTIVASSPEDIDKQVIDFGKDHAIEFTVAVPMSAPGTFQRLILYHPDAKEELETGPSANALKQQAEEEKPEKWVTCAVCKGYWKISHFNACKCSNTDKSKIIGPVRT